MGLFDKFKLKEKPKSTEPIIIKPIKTKPRKYWGYCYNEKFNVYCNGATVYVYDKDDNELARFKDIPYAYRAKLMPHTNILVVKSTTGYLAIYDLDTLTLLKKIAVTQTAIYRTSDFKKIATLFHNNKTVHFEAIEFDENDKCYF